MARRATEVALYARQNKLALRNGQLWLELEPDSVKAQQTVASLMVSGGRLDDAKPYLEAWIKAGKPEQVFMQLHNLFARQGDKQAVAKVVSNRRLRRHQCGGRSSAHRGYRRSIIDVLDQSLAVGTIRSLAGLMGIKGEIDAERRRYILDHTLVRGLEPGLLDPGNVAWNCKARLTTGLGPVSFLVSQRDLPSRLPEGWRISESVAGRVRIDVSEDAEILLPVTRALDVSAAGQLPTGFDPKSLYPGRGHPRAIQIALFAANDALGSLGIDWGTLSYSFRCSPCRKVAVFIALSGVTSESEERSRSAH